MLVAKVCMLSPSGADLPIYPRAGLPTRPRACLPTLCLHARAAYQIWLLLLTPGTHIQLSITWVRIQQNLENLQ